MSATRRQCAATSPPSLVDGEQMGLGGICLVAGVLGGGTPSPPLASPSSSLRVTPGTVFLAPGDATEVETTLTTEVSFGEDADLSVTALDTIEMSFAPAAGEASRGAPFRFALSIRTAPTTAPGVYTVSVAADTVVTENPTATLGVVVLPVGGAVATGRVQAIAGGGEHSLALANDRTVFGWGSNANRQLGQGPGKQSFPVEVLPFIFGVTAMGAGLDHSLFVVSDGTVRSRPPAWLLGRSGGD